MSGEYVADAIRELTDILTRWAERCAPATAEATEEIACILGRWADEADDEVDE